MEALKQIKQGFNKNRYQFKLKITVMDIQNREFPISRENNLSIETPVKKQKAETASDLKTAESPSLDKLSISDIEAEELFNEFSKIVVVTEEETEDLQLPEVYRKLEFQGELKSRLDFDQSTASMKKKRKNSKLEGSAQISIKPFKIEDSSEEKEVSSPCTPSLRIKNKVGILSTPTKKITQSADLEKAARKEDPFRDLEEKEKEY